LSLPSLRKKLMAKRATAVRFSDMWVSAVRWAGVPPVSVMKSMRPKTAAARAPRMPIPTSHCAPVRKGASSLPSSATTSKTRLAVHAPMGMVTRVGWSGCP
jgi:hypothetical protein